MSIHRAVTATAAALTGTHALDKVIAFRHRRHAWPAAGAAQERKISRWRRPCAAFVRVGGPDKVAIFAIRAARMNIGGMGASPREKTA